jgi:hypothetical protein
VAKRGVKKQDVVRSEINKNVIEYWSNLSMALFAVVRRRLHMYSTMPVFFKTIFDIINTKSKKFKKKQ